MGVGHLIRACHASGDGPKLSRDLGIWRGGGHDTTVGDDLTLGTLGGRNPSKLAKALAPPPPPPPARPTLLRIAPAWRTSRKTMLRHRSSTWVVVVVAEMEKSWIGGVTKGSDRNTGWLWYEHLHQPHATPAAPMYLQPRTEQGV